MGESCFTTSGGSRRGLGILSQRGWNRGPPPPLPNISGLPALADGGGVTPRLPTAPSTPASPGSSSCRRRRKVSTAAKSLATALMPTLRPSSQCVAAPPRAATSSARTRSGAVASSSTRPLRRSPPRYAPPGPRASSSAKLRTPRRRMAARDPLHTHTPHFLQEGKVDRAALCAPGPGGCGRCFSSSSAPPRCAPTSPPPCLFPSWFRVELRGVCVCVFGGAPALHTATRPRTRVSAARPCYLPLPGSPGLIAQLPDCPQWGSPTPQVPSLQGGAPLSSHPHLGPHPARCS